VTPTENQSEVFEAWLKECDKVGLMVEVAMDTMHAYFHSHPEECLIAMNGSMMDWDF
jgi:DNA-directed RNA polymerase subunit E'/Rpb7